MRKLSGTDAAILDDEELIRMALPAIRADYRAAETYVYEPGPDLRCPVVSLVGDDDPKVTVEGGTRLVTAHGRVRGVPRVPGRSLYLTAHQERILALLADHARAR